MTVSGQQYLLKNNKKTNVTQQAILRYAYITVLVIKQDGADKVSLQS